MTYTEILELIRAGYTKAEIDTMLSATPAAGTTPAAQEPAPEPPASGTTPTPSGTTPPRITTRNSLPPAQPPPRPSRQKPKNCLPRWV